MNDVSQKSNGIKVEELIRIIFRSQAYGSFPEPVSNSSDSFNDFTSVAEFLS